MSLYVGNLPDHARQQDLESAFQTYGPCSVEMKVGYAFVSYSCFADAEKALQALSDMPVHDGNLRISWAARQPLLAPTRSHRDESSRRLLDADNRRPMHFEDRKSMNQSRPLLTGERRQFYMDDHEHHSMWTQDGRDRGGLASRRANGCSNCGEPGHDFCKSVYVDADYRGEAFHRDRSEGRSSDVSRRHGSDKDQRHERFHSTGSDSADHVTAKQLIREYGSHHRENRPRVSKFSDVGYRGAESERGRSVGPWRQEAPSRRHESGAANVDSTQLVKGHYRNRERPWYADEVTVKQEVPARVRFCSDCGQLGHDSLNCDSSVGDVGYDRKRGRDGGELQSPRDICRGDVSRGSRTRGFDGPETTRQQGHVSPGVVPRHLSSTDPGYRRRVLEPREESARHVKREYSSPAHVKREYPSSAREYPSPAHVKREHFSHELTPPARRHKSADQEENRLSEDSNPSNPALQTGAPNLRRFKDLLKGTKDERIWVRETVKFFEQYRTYLIEKEGENRREALKEARKFMMEHGLALNKGKRSGSVPGVEVGQEFHYRAELEIVGMHFSPQGGIDSRMDNGKSVAVSIVISGGYEDNFDGGEIVEFTGQGGMDGGKQTADQQLVRGNLAMTITQERGYPIRVIRGIFNAESKKTIYTYAGLYSIFKSEQVVGRSGFKVWKFHLRRNPGQVSLGRL